MRDLQAFEVQAVTGGNSGVSFTAAMILTPLSNDPFWVTAVSTGLGLLCAAPLVPIQGSWLHASLANAGAVFLGSITGQFFGCLVEQLQSDQQSS